MKKTALQFTNQFLQEAKHYNEYDYNIAEYLINTIQNKENGYFFYLTDDEIEEFEENIIRREELKNEVETFINENFDFNFEKFDY